MQYASALVGERFPSASGVDSKLSALTVHTQPGCDLGPLDLFHELYSSCFWLSKLTVGLQEG